ncbi:MAG: InlB B-repeat-containing protein, partial [Clostridia bacterium]|nr:InlB B-repeat-containing protein [Clostridia bacterium]
MKLTKKIIAIVLCLSFLTAIPFYPTVNAYSPSNGEFVFSSNDMLSYIKEPYSVDVSYDQGSSSMLMKVNNDHNASDPRALLDLSSLSLSASNYKSLLIIYRVPTNTSAYATTTELFLSAGAVQGPTAGKSVMYQFTKGVSFTSHIVDLSSLSWWSGQIHSIRIDPFTSAVVGDSMYIDSIMLCSDYNSAIAKRDTRIAELNNVSTPDYSGSDYVCTKYEYDKYTSPLWKGNIVYNEAVYPVKDKSGNSVYTLMYTPDEITSVYSADFSSRYYEGIDYTVSGNKITFLSSGSISLKNYTYIHPQSNPNGYSWDTYYNRTAAGDGKWEYWGQNPVFYNGYINVSYTHSDTWSHYVPEQKSSSLPRTADTIKNGGAMNVVFFGDSICGGANSSSYRDVYPYAEYWNEMIVSKLRKDYGLRVNATYSAEGGGAAPDLVAKTDEWVTAYAPDLVFIEFGVNDAMNWSQDSSGSASGLKREFKSAINDIIAEVRDTYPNCEFVLVAPFYGNIYCHYMSYFEACRDALNEIASANTGVAVADVTAIHSSLLEIKNYLDFSGDNMCHPNDFMARIYAQVCLEAIVPGGVEAYTVDSEPPVTEPDVGNTTEAAPGGYGWQWPSGEAYGYIGNYGGNGQDIVFNVDLSLISSDAEEASALFYVAQGDSIKITPTGVYLGGRTYAYSWGNADISNWRTVTITIKNGAAAVYIDGDLVGNAQSGYTAYTDYQLFFSYTGCMAIDNVTLKSSTGTTYVDCDFENESEASNLMSTGLGKRTLLAANTVTYNLNGGTGTVKNQIKVNGTDLTLTTDVPERDGYTFLGWSKSSSAASVDYASGATYASNSSVTLYAVWQSAGTTEPEPEPEYPEIISISPTSCRITDKGTGAYNITAEGNGLTYSWSCSDSTLIPYMSGTDTATLSISIDTLLEKSFDATFTCTVTNAEGNSTESSPVS